MNRPIVVPGERAMESKNSTKPVNCDIGGVQLAEEAVLFESLMEGIGLPVEQTGSSTSRLTDGPHPISTETSETITLHYPMDTTLNPNSLIDNDLDNGNASERTH